MKHAHFSIRSQDGLTLPEMLVYLALFAIVGFGILQVSTNLFRGVSIEESTQEIETILGASETYRKAPGNSGSYTNISIARLSTRGYNVSPLTDGVAENTYGLNVQVAAASGGGDLTLTYQTEDNEICLQLVERFTGGFAVKGAPSCNTGTLTLTRE